MEKIYSPFPTKPSFVSKQLRYLWCAVQIVLLVLLTSFSYAQNRLVTWNFVSAEQPIQSPFLATTNDVRMNASPITRSTGINAASYDSSFVASGWDASSLADAISQGEYMQFTLDPKDQFKVSLSTLNAVVYKSLNGPTHYQVLYSLNGFATPGTPIQGNRQQTGVFGAYSATGKAETYDLSTQPALQALPGTSLVTFRLYAWGAPSSDGIFGFYHRDTENNLRLNGSTESLDPDHPAYVWNPYPSRFGGPESGVEGAILGEWGRSNFWVPERTNPSAQDILLFDTGINTLVTQVPDQEIHQMRVDNNTQVTLRPSYAPEISTGTVTFNAPVPAVALVVQQGSILRFTTVQGTRSIVFQFPSNTQALIGGTVIFDSYPLVASQDYELRQTNHRLLAMDPNAIIFQNGSTFEAGKFSGHPFGDDLVSTTTGLPRTPVEYQTSGSVLFQSGSRYLFRGGLNPFGLTAPASKTVFNTGSLFLLKDYDFPPQLAGRTYGDFVIDLAEAPSNKQALEILNAQAPEAMTVNNFTIEHGTLSFPMTASTSLPYLNIQVNGSFTVAGGASFNFAPPAPSTLSFGSTAQPQTIGGAGQMVLGPNTTLQINTPASVTLNRELTIEGTLQLTQGTLFTSGLNSLLTITPSGNILGGSAASFIDGPVRLAVATTDPTSLIFPLGDEDFAKQIKVYRPVSLDLTLDTNSLTYFTATLVPGTPTPTRAFPSDDVPPGGLEDVSWVRHYTLVKDGPTTLAEGTVTLPFGPDDNVTDLPNLRIATANNEPTWINLGQDSVSAPSESSPLGFITATLPDASQFGTFVLANAIGGTNPLPVELISFTAQQNQASVQLRWATASEQENKGFEILRSRNGSDWEKISFVAGQGTTQNSQQYQYTDQTLPAGESQLYYRLKQVDLDGKFTFSKIVTVSPSGHGPSFVAYPNPTPDELHVQLGQPGTEAVLRISNLLGQTVMERTYAAPSHHISERLGSLPTGTYLLEVRQGDQRFTQRLVKTGR